MIKMPYKVRTTVTRGDKKSPYVEKTIVETKPFRRSKVSRRPRMTVFENGIGMMYEKSFDSKRKAKKYLKKNNFTVSGFVDRDSEGFIFANKDYKW